jgi:hypothetical protein
MLKFRERFEGIGKGVRTLDVRREGLVVERASQALLRATRVRGLGLCLTPNWLLGGPRIVIKGCGKASYRSLSGC